jgi:hypothetical protein
MEHSVRSVLPGGERLGADRREFFEQHSTLTHVFLLCDRLMQRRRPL